jgi:hypothetical protein
MLTNARFVKLLGEGGVNPILMQDWGENPWSFSKALAGPRHGLAPSVAKPIVGSASGGLTRGGRSSAKANQWILQTLVC